ncbi:MAG: ZIP family metal transporter [Candidatus Korarchaeota archaeon]|nr:ZIP family metal transporter [Candidatus Korarchaeota archaeon]NIU82147.1 ZIP family metal transporter [Candidatus Thorarchaeota archaeon]NIW12590.1 ZIP family metal transporter [Candidatus Thorarchaeota archaeon]NIW51401.1 ZIP family metal transporter [Candidatus Korarchaeota archaeon]
MGAVTYAFLSVLFISSLSLVGVLMISMKEKTVDNVLFILVAFATGTILATSLFDLIPESLHHLEVLNAEGASLPELLAFGLIGLGYVAFFIIERFIYWFHGHAHVRENQIVCYDTRTGQRTQLVEKGTNIKNVALLNLMGDGLHNFLDGVIILVAFSTGLANGIVITLAVLFHELPQELGDFGILLYGGFTKRTALLFNFGSALVAVLGGIFALFFSELIQGFNFFFLAFSGGGFLYLATTELMPELTKQKPLKKSIIQAIIFLIGVLFVLSLVLFLPHG